MTTRDENCLQARDEAADVLHSATWLLESVASLSEQLAAGSEESEITWLKGLILRRGDLINRIVEHQPAVSAALKAAGRNSPAVQYFSDLTKKILKCDDILLGALAKRKEVVAGHIECEQNQGKLQLYAT